MEFHTAPGGTLSGTFQPDGRNTNPLTAVDSSSRNAPLSLFKPTVPTGDWNLFIADVAGGDEATLMNWSVSLTGPKAIPEPGVFFLLVGGSSTFLFNRSKL